VTAAGGLADRLRRLSQRRSTPLLLALLAFILTLPALGGGLLGDDYFQRVVLADIGEWGAATDPVRDLFAFVPDRLAGQMLDMGYLPWWSDPGIRVALARPLTALTHVLDYALWPDTFALQHLQSLLWFALGVGLVAILYRRLHASGVTAGLAGLLFALEDAHAMNAAWLANRNALLCLVAGTAALLLHIAWRRSRRALHLILALATFALGLGFGEATLGAIAYIAAWQVACDQGRLVKRLLPLLPYVVIVAAWRVLYDMNGYGVEGSWLYTDPGRQPFEFLAALVERWPLLFAAQWFQLPVDMWLTFRRAAQIEFSAVAAVLVAGLLALLWPLLRREAMARFYAIGMAASLVAPCAAFPMDRLLVFAGLGAFGLLAMLAEATRAWPWDRDGARGWRRRAAQALLVLHGPVAGLALVLRIVTLPVLFSDVFSAADRQAPRGPEVAGQTFVFVNGNDFPVVYCHVMRVATGDAPAPRRVAQLAMVTTTNRIWREDPRTLVITADGGFLSHALDRLLASPRPQFARGERIERPDYIAEIRSVTSDRRPLEVAFRFRQPPEDPGLRWLYWKNHRLQEFPLPRVGERVIVEGVLP